MILSDRSLRDALAAGRISVDPLSPGAIQPSSIDLRLDALFRVFRNYSAGHLDLAAIPDDLTELVEVPFGRAFMLHPGEFVLGSTIEHVRVGEDLVARLEGKSSLGRLGLLIHSTAGFIDPGFEGHVTLELSNVAQLPITLYPGMRVGQISFLQMTSPAEHPYGSAALASKYQGQRGPTPSRYHLDHDDIKGDRRHHEATEW
ncbi:deoxycytidine triphosphate deaminase [Acidimicrobium ferrooxidans DSM 10331]|uniref:dCTP deaminase, dUMP-forming n=1 Tax=Acidimicrobium ferrooxidans (strain DSM 10331 / JCM 15462 / NBRC 103882 / ICP) TaxID=525909 RepID=C7M1H8_ACIFD|nr:dCTP deaminase [Acidimicrobium ferrooxidans]ACU53027.1 deoxycytidine triphosphate deaminase [Acidimicrobium ferrooxidans DSM 10331]